jgi:hypothetical protein
LQGWIILPDGPFGFPLISSRLVGCGQPADIAAKKNFLMAEKKELT